MTRVVITYLHRDTVSHSFMTSLDGVRIHDPSVIVGKIPIFCPSGQLGTARNNSVRAFLDGTDADWFWTVDTDMGFAPDTLEQLLRSADPDTRPVVSALCYSLQSAGSDGLGGYRVKQVPAAYDEKMQQLDSVPADTRVRVGGTGAACLLVHRSALERIRDRYGDHWFTESDDGDGLRMGEDVSFCYRLSATGAPVYVDTRVRTSHHKSMWFSGQE